MGWCANLGVMTSLLQEIISVYPLLNPSQLTAAASNRVCNALALLQCVASHQDTRPLFLGGMSASSLCQLEYALTNDSTHPPLPLPIPQHHLEIPPLRIPPPHLPRRHWRTSQKRQLGGDQLPPHDGNHPALPSHHGNGLGAQQDRGHLHCAKDPARRHGAAIHLPDVRALLRRGHRAVEYGDAAGGPADGATAQARCSVLLAVGSFKATHGSQQDTNIHICTGCQITPAPVKLFANACQSPCATPPSPPSCETTPQLSGAWRSSYSPCRIRRSRTRRLRTAIHSKVCCRRTTTPTRQFFTNQVTIFCVYRVR